MRVQQRVGSICWALCAQYLVAEWLTSLAWRLPYSYVTNYISDLGALGCDEHICSPWHALMNASFCLQGILIVTGAVLLASAAESRSRAFKLITASLWVISGLGVFIVGIFPEDTRGATHALGAAAHFLAGGLAICLFGISNLRVTENRRKGWLSIVVGILVLAATLLLGERNSGWPVFDYTGVIERVASYGITLWLVVTGIQNYRHRQL